MLHIYTKNKYKKWAILFLFKKLFKKKEINYIEGFKTDASILYNHLDMLNWVPIIILRLPKIEYLVIFCSSLVSIILTKFKLSEIKSLFWPKLSRNCINPNQINPHTISHH